MHTSHPKTESFAEVFRKRLWLLLLCALLLVLVCALSLILTARNGGKIQLHSKLPPSDLGLTELSVSNDAQEDAGTVLTETARADESYVADALFCGDSISDGYRVYTEVFSGFRTATMIGLSPQAVSYQTFKNKTGDPAEEMTMLQMIQYFNPKKIYIMLGTNGLEWGEPDALIAGYETFLDEVIAAMPTADIIVESIPSTTEATAISRPGFSKERILQYNAMLKEMAGRKGVYFLDIYEAIVGPDGYTPVEIAAASDGIHFTPDGYRRIKDYILTHTVQGDDAYSIGSDGFIQFTAA